MAIGIVGCCFLVVGASGAARPAAANGAGPPAEVGDQTSANAADWPERTAPSSVAG
jgi:hypothetical protein